MPVRPPPTKRGDGMHQPDRLTSQGSCRRALLPISLCHLRQKLSPASRAFRDRRCGYRRIERRGSCRGYARRHLPCRTLPTIPASAPSAFGTRLRAAEPVGRPSVSKFALARPSLMFSSIGEPASWIFPGFCAPYRHPSAVNRLSRPLFGSSRRTAYTDSTSPPPTVYSKDARRYPSLEWRHLGNFPKRSDHSCEVERRGLSKWLANVL